MSIEILFRLVCNGCNTPFEAKPRTTTEFLQFFKVVDFRAAAREEGWQMFRLRPSGDKGDYCPVCVEKILAERSARKRVSAINGRARRDKP